MEELTKLSRAEAADEGVPVPELNAIGDITNDEVGADPSVEEADPSVGEGGASEPSPIVAGQGGVTAEDDITTSALELPGDAQEAASTTAAALLNEATSADDISFAVYLSTLWSIDEARRYWQAMQNAMPDVFQGKQLEIEEVAASAGTEPFYRVLTTPYTSDPEAQAACELIKAKLRTQDCSVVVRDAAIGG